MSQNSSSGGSPKLIGLKDPVKDKEVPCSGTVTVGRDPTSNTLPLTHPSISRKHARVYLEAGTWVVEDLNSSNGVYLNDTKVDRAKLKEGDVVKIGEVPFRFTLGLPPKAAAAPEAGFEPTLMMAPPPGVKPKPAELPTDFEGTVFGGQAPSFFVDAMKKESAASAETAKGGAPASAAKPVYAAPRTDELPNLFWLKIKSAVVIAAVVLVAIGGILLLVRSQGKKEAVKKALAETRQRFNDFIDESERKTLEDSDVPEAFAAQLKKLEVMQKEVAGKQEEFTGSAVEFTSKLQEFKEKISFLIFERKLRMAVLAKDKAGTEKLLQDLQAQGAEAQKALIPLTRHVVDYLLFLDAFPMGPERSEVSPNRKEVARLKKNLPDWKAECVNNKSNSMMMLGEFYKGLADKVEQNIELPLEQWKRFWDAVDLYEKAPAADKKKELERFRSSYPNVKLDKELP